MNDANSQVRVLPSKSNSPVRLLRRTPSERTGLPRLETPLEPLENVVAREPLGDVDREALH